MKRRTNHIITVAIVVGLGMALVGGICLLFDLRFESGDNYPPYSTLRADPLGTRGLYDSLQALRGVTATRNLRPLCELHEGAGATLFYLGIDPDDLQHFGKDDSNHIESFLLSGGRLVLSLAPQTRRPSAFLLTARSTVTTATLTSTTVATRSSAAPTTSTGGGSLRKAQAEAEAEEQKLAAKRQAAKPAPT